MSGSFTESTIHLEIQYFNRKIDSEVPIRKTQNSIMESFVVNHIYIINRQKVFGSMWATQVIYYLVQRITANHRCTFFGL